MRKWKFQGFFSFFGTQQVQQNERPDHGHSVRDELEFIAGQPLYVHRKSCKPTVPVHHLQSYPPSLSLHQTNYQLQD